MKTGTVGFMRDGLEEVFLLSKTKIQTLKIKDVGM